MQATWGFLIMAGGIPNQVLFDLNDHWRLELDEL